MAAPLTPLAAAGISVGSDLLNNLFSGGSNRRQNKRMVDFWKMNNEYNHPSAQMARLKEAGLNPAMMYGNGTAASVGNSSSAPKATPRDAPSIKNPMQAYQNTEQFNLQTDLLRKENTLREQDMLLKSLQAEGMSTGNKASLKKLESMDMLTELNLDSLAHKNREARNRANMSARELDILYELSEDKIKYFKQQVKNAENIGALRAAELEIKKELMKFTTANQATSIIAKWLQLLK